jgi:hypothetical protein
VLGVPDSKAFRHQLLDELAQQLRARIAEKLLRLSVYEHDVAIAVDDHDRVRRGLEQRPKLVFGAPAIRGISDRGGDELPPRCLQRRQADLCWKLAAVLAQAVELDASSHRARAWLRKVCVTVPRMQAAVAFGDQRFHRASDELRGLVTKEPFRVAIRQLNATIRANDHGSVGRRIQESAKRGLDHVIVSIGIRLAVPHRPPRP